MAEDDVTDRADGPDENDAAAAIRAECRAARRAIGAHDRATAARRIADRLTTVVPAQPAGSVGSYLPTDGEIDPTFVVEVLRAAGWQVHLPVVGPEHSMQFAPFHEDTLLRENRYGIEEPVHDRGDLVAARSLDLLLVPCVAIDPRGNRLGFGAGYYDRALSDAEDPTMASSRPRPLLVGLVFDLQVVESVPHHPWDVALDVVVCESAAMFTGVRGWPQRR